MLNYESEEVYQNFNSGNFERIKKLDYEKALHSHKCFRHCSIQIIETLNRDNIMQVTQVRMPRTKDKAETQSYIDGWPQ